MISNLPLPGIIILAITAFRIGLPKLDSADKKIFHPDTNELIPNFNKKPLRYSKKIFRTTYNVCFVLSCKVLQTWKEVATSLFS